MQAAEAVLNAAKVSTPPVLVEKETRRILAQLHRNLEAYGVDPHEHFTEHGSDEKLKDPERQKSVEETAEKKARLNLILDAIRYNKPFILTKETGLYDRVKDCAVFVDPENVTDIAEKIRWLSVSENYEMQKRKVEAFPFTHTWEQIAEEFLSLAKNL